MSSGIKWIELFKKLQERAMSHWYNKEVKVKINNDLKPVSLEKDEFGEYYFKPVKIVHEWHPYPNTLPKTDRYVTVKDSSGKEYEYHQWNGMKWYVFLLDDKGADGWPSSVDVTMWKYQD